jgi:large subunit ribosomal protein L9|tara:strand:+ start:1001 stop:1456 length:456 start_codon:yes stop_codon:yes gene_type:complete
MEIILLENINKLGKIGDQVKVKNGYGRNYLLRQGKALRASKENIELVDKKKEELNKKNNKIKSEFLEIAKKINNKILKFKKESKDNGDLFGTIKPKEISNAFTNELRIQITPSQINLKKEIDKIGDYKIEINLYSEVSTTVTIKVQKIEAK